MTMNRTQDVKAKSRGASMTEFLLVAPVLLLIGFGLVQIGLIFHAKNALNFALQEAARMGSVHNASQKSIEQGLIRGLVPFMGGGKNATELATTLGAATAEVTRGTAEGWIRLKQLSPMSQSFNDWEEDSTDEKGAAVREIPNANLAVLRCTRAPNDGSDGRRSSTACGAAGERIGSGSQQTLADANLLKLELTYGVKLVVPFLNRIVGKALSMMAGCAAPARQQVGVLNLDAPALEKADPIACASYNAVDAKGNADPRLPVNLAVTVRMQSPPRRAGAMTLMARSRSSNTGGVSLGNGVVDPATTFAPVPVSELNPAGLTLAADDGDGTGKGSMKFGAAAALVRAVPATGTAGSSGSSDDEPASGDDTMCKVSTVTRTPAEDRPDGVLGAVFDALKVIAGDAFDFVRGLWDGLKDQLSGMVEMITSPIETAKGIYQLAKSLATDFTGTAKQIGAAVGTEFTKLVKCGFYEKGFFIGNNVDPAYVLKVTSKLAKFASLAGDLEKTRLARALEEAAAEMPCASFAAGTPVWTYEGNKPIESLIAGALVHSRDKRSYFDGPNRIQATYNRTTPEYYILITERDVFRVSAEHPLWVQGRGWTPVKDIQLGWPVATENGDTLILAKDLERHPLQVFNFGVESTSSYFVGNEHIWAHNADCDIKSWSPWKTQSPKEGNGGNWLGQRANSEWMPQPGSPLYEATGGKPVVFKQGYPDFEPFAYVRDGKPVELHDISLTGKSSDIEKANAEYRKLTGMDPPEGYTWHHHQDCKTLILVPKVVNSIPHTGGAANIRNGTCV